MTPNLKTRAKNLLALRHAERGSDLARYQHGVIALLQELVNEPEPEPVARVTGYYGGYLSIATVDGRVLPAGTALYAAPPHQSEQHLEMVKRELFQAQQALLNEAQQRDALLAALENIIAITNDSQGVAGYHLNGDIADWDSFQEIAEAEAAIAEAKGEGK